MHDSAVLRLVQIALVEDIGTGDVTSETLIDEEILGHGDFLLKESGVIAGTVVAGMVLGEVDRDLSCLWHFPEGTYCESGTIIGRVTGPIRSILTAERTALNFLQRMSGVATLTARYVDAVAGTTARILDTRKTIPGWRLLDKYAVTIGGGVNHRMGLDDMVMIKDNHIAAHGSIRSAVERVRQQLTLWNRAAVPIEVETKNIEEVREALDTQGIARIMFDNFDVATMLEAVALVAGSVETEASGGITLESVAAYAGTGVDFISVGALTHSANALDISLEL